MIVSIFVIFFVSPQEEWGYKLLTCGKTLKVEINIPASCIVASYSMAIESIYKQGAKRRTAIFNYDKPVYILFNAWCPGETVAYYHFLKFFYIFA